MQSSALRVGIESVKGHRAIQSALHRCGPEDEKADVAVVLITTPPVRLARGRHTQFDQSALMHHLQFHRSSRTVRKDAVAFQQRSIQCYIRASQSSDKLLQGAVR